MVFVRETLMATLLFDPSMSALSIIRKSLLILSEQLACISLSVGIQNCESMVCCCCAGVQGVRVSACSGVCRCYHCRHLVAVGCSSEVWWSLEAEGWKVFVCLYIRVSACLCLCVLTTLKTGGKLEGTRVDIVTLCCVMWCYVALFWFAFYLDTVNRPTCRWTQTPKKTREVQDMKDERGDER